MVKIPDAQTYQQNPISRQPVIMQVGKMEIKMLWVAASSLIPVVIMDALSGSLLTNGRRKLNSDLPRPGADLLNLPFYSPIVISNVSGLAIRSVDSPLQAGVSY